ncbi:MAG: SH3 domain-containing protein [Cyanobacteriota bacterium]|nr:SH3 domain-containing protein [Cyanobacteriota bacterium]
MTTRLPSSTPPILTWAALLGIALFAPAALPAGGADRRMPELRRRESPLEPLLNPTRCTLRAAPRAQAPRLGALEAGVPLRVLHTWIAPGGRRWLRVATRETAGRTSRGWLPG